MFQTTNQIIISTYFYNLPCHSATVAFFESHTSLTSLFVCAALRGDICHGGSDSANYRRACFNKRKCRKWNKTEKNRTPFNKFAATPVGA